MSIGETTELDTAIKPLTELENDREIPGKALILVGPNR
jgi:hypothetical protein